MIEIDGTKGGGQVVRTALALSTLTGKEFVIDNIRSKRPNPGLAAQHLTCVHALQELCGASVEGAVLGSSELTFKPGKIKSQTLDVDIGTAGSITLFMQSLLLPAICCGKRVNVRVKGGTDVKWSMPIDYFSSILIPQLRRYADVKFTLERRGYYPKGNGVVEIKMRGKNDVEPLSLLEQGYLMIIKGVSHASNNLADVSVSEREAKAAEVVLKKYDCPVQIRSEYKDTLSTGTGIVLWASFSKDKTDMDSNNPIIIGGDCLGEKSKKAEAVGEEAANNLVAQISTGAPVDKYMADNLIPFLGVFGGSIRVAEVTEHTLSNIYVVEKFLDVQFSVSDGLISVSDNK